MEAQGAGQDVLEIIRIVLDFVIVPLAVVGWALIRQVNERCDDLQSKIDDINNSRMGLFNNFRREISEERERAIASVRGDIIGLRSELVSHSREVFTRLDRLRDMQDRLGGRGRGGGYGNNE